MTLGRRAAMKVARCLFGALALSSLTACASTRGVDIEVFAPRTPVQTIAFTKQGPSSAELERVPDLRVDVECRSCTLHRLGEGKYHLFTEHVEFVGVRIQAPSYDPIVMRVKPGYVGQIGADTVIAVMHPQAPLPLSSAHDGAERKPSTPRARTPSRD